MDVQLNSVGAVVVTYNRRHMLERALDSLLRQTRPVDCIYIVDNASTDGTEQYLSTLNNPKISIKRMTTNTGGAGGFSYGMKWAFDEGHEWIWMMDDDILPATDCLERLLSFGAPVTNERTEMGVPQQEHPFPPPAALVPLRLNQNGMVAEWSATKKINLSNPLVRAFRSDLVCDLYSDPSSVPPVIPVNDFTFEGPIFHRRVPEQVGLPRAEFFIYCDETEYALRMQRFGFPLPLCVSGARAVRIGERPSFQENGLASWREYYAWRNLLVVQRIYAANLIMVFRPYLFFVLSTFKRLLARKLTLNEIVMRWHAFCDAIAEVFPCRYLPQQGRKA